MTPLTPSDVRLGNLTSHGVVTDIHSTYFTAKSEADIHFTFETDILPVPLTPEILDGFGFKHDGVLSLGINQNGLDYITADHKNGVGLYSDYGDAILLPEIKHAHTLQNFVQAISGVELVYKPNKTK